MFIRVGLWTRWKNKVHSLHYPSDFIIQMVPSEKQLNRVDSKILAVVILQPSVLVYDSKSYSF